MITDPIIKDLLLIKKELPPQKKIHNPLSSLSNHTRLMKQCRRLGFFPITKMDVEIVRILMRNFNTTLLKYQTDRINNQKSGVRLFDACDPSLELPRLVQLK